jgi:alpha-glucosidase
MLNPIRRIRPLAPTQLLAALLLAGCAGRPPAQEGSVAQGPLADTTLTLASPDSSNTLLLRLEGGELSWEVDRRGTPVLERSRLGLRFRDVPALDGGFRLLEVERSRADSTWTQPWGEVARVRDHHEELVATLAASGGWTLRLRLRAYDGGVAFRYELPQQQGHGGELLLMDELTEFALAGDPTAWWIPAYHPNRYEYLYRSTPASQMDTVHTPATFQTGAGVAFAIHEAALTDYASMTLLPTGGTKLECDLVPWSDGVKVRRALPLVSPWRVVLLGDEARDLVASTLVLNLNEPSRIEDTSWIEPAKYVGIWWELHLGLTTWGSGEKHGATTENARRYIDFAARHGFGGVLVEGWNIGWDGDWSANAELFNFTEPYADYDLPWLAAYAAEQGVRLIAHNETSTGILNYEQQLEEAFALYRKHGIRAVKTGYVGHGRQIRRRDPESGEVLGLEWHHGQWMVNHYRRVVEAAARHGLLLDVHEPIKGTGIERTWPNMMTREGARGQEYNAWGPEGGNPPSHTAILPYTRMLAGPFDFTPGIFDILLSRDERPANRVNTTLAKQLALYVVLFSPLQMAADLPENYENHPALPFLENVPVNWARTEVLAGAIGEYIVLARQQRGGEDWYLGALTDEEGRTLSASLDFLDEDAAYRATIYRDGPDADWFTQPLDYVIEEKEVRRGETLELRLAPGGGQAIRFEKLASP